MFFDFTAPKSLTQDQVNNLTTHLKLNPSDYARPANLQIIVLIACVLVCVLSLANLALAWTVVIQIRFKCQMNLRAVKSKFDLAAKILETRKISDETLNKIAELSNFDVEENKQELEGYLTSMVDKLEKN